MSRLDSSISQILGTDGDGRRAALIQYISQQPAPVRAALLIDDDPTTNPPDQARQAAVTALAAVGSGFKIDPAIMLQGGDPRTIMQMRLDAGLYWVASLNGTPVPLLPDNATGIPQATADTMPGDGILVTTDFSTPAADLEVTGTNPVGSRFTSAPGSDPNAQDYVKGTQSNGVGSTYWPAEGDESPELSTFTGAKGGKYQKLSVLALHPNAAAESVWVRLA